MPQEASSLEVLDSIPSVPQLLALVCRVVELSLAKYWRELKQCAASSIPHLVTFSGHFAAVASKMRSWGARSPRFVRLSISMTRRTSTAFTRHATTLHELQRMASAASVLGFNLLRLEVDESNCIGTGKFAVVHLCNRKNQPEKKYALKVRGRASALSHVT